MPQLAQLEADIRAYIAEHGYDGYRQLSDVLKHAYAHLPDVRIAESDPDGSVHSYGMGHTEVEGEYHGHSSSDGTTVISSGRSEAS